MSKCGTNLKRLISYFAITPSGQCDCETRAAQMDEWGPEKCRENMETIIGWLKEEAGIRGIPFYPAFARLFVEHAIRNAEAELVQFRKF